MKNSTIAVILLAGLNVAFLLDEYCVVDWIGKDCGIVVPITDCACDDGKRYQNEREGGGTQVGLEDARQYVENFQRKYSTPKKGAFISKRALDFMFCENQQANGIFCYFGMKNDDPESFVLVLEEGKQDQTLINKTTEPGHIIFMGERMCPSICGTVGE